MKDFNCYNHGTNQIDVIKHSPIERYKFRIGRPIEMHLKENGSKDDKPSFAIVIELSNGNRIIGEISLQMLNEGLKDIGYKLLSVEELGGLLVEFQNNCI